jgi:hypothetical protein
MKAGRKIIRGSIAATLAIFLLASCASGREQIDAEEMYIRASALTKLSAAVESAVRYKNPPSDLEEQELLVFSTRHDPVLLENFKGYKIRVLRRERHSVVLVCNATGARALLEDAGCTGPMDRARWKEQPQPCEFSINTASVCGVD